MTVGLAAILACGGTTGGTVRAAGGVRYAEVERQDRGAFLGEQVVIASSPSMREKIGDPTMTVEARPDPVEWVVHVTVGGPDAEKARAWCDAVLDDLVKRRVDGHRTELEVQRKALGDAIAASTDPAKTVELRRKLEDLAAARARTDARVVGPCATAP
jgi:hypothetical protein